MFAVLSNIMVCWKCVGLSIWKCKPQFWRSDRWLRVIFLAIDLRCNNQCQCNNAMRALSKGLSEQIFFLHISRFLGGKSKPLRNFYVFNHFPKPQLFQKVAGPRKKLRGADAKSATFYVATTSRNFFMYDDALLCSLPTLPSHQQATT